MNLTRRNFVAGSALGTVALATCAPAALADDAAATADPLYCNLNVIGSMSEPSATYEADIVVLGAGPAGICCACRAAELGAKVQVVEKLDYVGGTGLVASGNCYISLNSKLQLEQGLEADVRAFYAEWLEAVHYHCDHEVLSAYLRNCGRVVDWLYGYGFEFYMKEVQPTNGLSGNEYRISQPSSRGDVRPAVYNAMMGVVEAAGGSVAYSVTAQELIVDETGAVKGVRCLNDDDQVVDYMGKAVVIATGGYAANRDMVDALCTPPFLGRDPVRNNGEGAKMAWSAGAMKPWNLGIMCCDSLYGVDANYNAFSSGCTQICNVMNDPGKSLIHVNQFGKRYHSEDAFCWVPTYGGANAIACNEPYLFALIDHATLMPEGGKVTQEVVDEAKGYGYVFEGATIEELAVAAGLDPATLRATFDEYAGFCANAEDPVFFKNPQFLVPYGEGPYYAIRLAPVPFGSCGDLAVTPQMEVRGAEPGTVVPNLYAIGSESVGVMHNDYYWALGQTVGWGHTSGVLAAEAICAKL